MTHPFLDHPLPLAFAHRGAGPEFEENTLPAFDRAVAMGYTHIETDVQASRDGVAVVFHDDDLARIMGRPEKIGDLDWAELSTLRTKTGVGLSRLDDVLEAHPDRFLNIDAKSDAVVDPLIATLKRHEAGDRCLVASFDVRRTKRIVREAHGQICWSPGHLGVAGEVFRGWHLPWMRPACHALQVPLKYGPVPIVTPGLIRAAHRRGVQVHVWTIDDAAEMDRLLDMGVDGIMTDEAQVLKDVLIQRGCWHGTA